MYSPPRARCECMNGPTWYEIAKLRWPRSTVTGNGQFAVLTCALQHTSGQQTVYSDIHLFETLEAAKQARTTVYCRAHTKGLCSGIHKIIDLL
jgi:hypothetical protein